MEIHIVNMDYHVVLYVNYLVKNDVQTIGTVQKVKREDEMYGNY